MTTTTMTIVTGYVQPSGPEGPKIPITKEVEMVDADGNAPNGGLSVLPAPDVLEMLGSMEE